MLKNVKHLLDEYNTIDRVSNINKSQTPPDHALL